MPTMLSPACWPVSVGLVQSFCGRFWLNDTSLLVSVSARMSPGDWAGAVAAGAIVVSRTSSLASSRVTAPPVAATPVLRLIR